MPDGKRLTADESRKVAEKQVRDLANMPHEEVSRLTEPVSSGGGRAVSDEGDASAFDPGKSQETKEQPAGDDVSSQIVQVLQEIKGAIESLPDDIVQRLEG